MNQPGEFVGCPDASWRVGATHPSPTIESSESALKSNLCVGRLYITQEFVGVNGQWSVIGIMSLAHLPRQTLNRAPYGFGAIHALDTVFRTRSQSVKGSRATSLAVVSFLGDQSRTPAPFHRGCNATRSATLSVSGMP